jgi:putative FmdB family regulatory protein
LPTADYTCKTCQHTFSRVVLRGEEDAPAECPRCRSRKVVRLPAAEGLFGGIAPFSGLGKDTN